MQACFIVRAAFNILAPEKSWNIGALFFSRKQKDLLGLGTSSFWHIPNFLLRIRLANQSLKQSCLVYRYILGGQSWLETPTKIIDVGILKLVTFTLFFGSLSLKLVYGCFQKWWYPQIINFKRVFQYKPSILGYPYFWKHPYLCGNDRDSQPQGNHLVASRHIVPAAVRSTVDGLSIPSDCM